ncbi:unnamed protein product [Staurois parvus]|uniref:Uncharacterized protein n=1 Tax=Staurois parvus TaxID=386267 RepID=A0ABN9AIH8_9NEOB|nr:unnamed protein product [Staurois parvus]
MILQSSGTCRMSQNTTGREDSYRFQSPRPGAIGLEVGTYQSQVPTHPPKGANSYWGTGKQSLK